MSNSAPLTRAVYREQILGEFMSSYLSARPQALNDTTYGERIPPNWLTLLSSMPDLTTALEATIIAVCISKLGRINNDLNLVRESLKFYTQGLSELQKALWDPKLMYRDETLVACMLLIIYEVAECPQNTINGWQNHMKGCAMLAQLRGPKAYGSEFGHYLFLSFSQIEAGFMTSSTN